MKKDKNSMGGIKELPEIKVYECGKCQATCPNINELLKHYLKCGEPDPEDWSWE
ncbi:MAG: hypothetical protein MN733_25560 [Nitrososphaera sp.]|nr:hypothetical protein [Nitrososphaera sp.]